jgi:hypothetical protein
LKSQESLAKKYLYIKKFGNFFGHTLFAEFFLMFCNICKVREVLNNTGPQKWETSIFKKVAILGSLFGPKDAFCS